MCRQLPKGEKKGEKLMMIGSRWLLVVMFAAPTEGQNCMFVADCCYRRQQAAPGGGEMKLGLMSQDLCHGAEED